MLHARLEVPSRSLGAVLAAAARLDAAVEAPELAGDIATVGGLVAAVRLDALQRQLPGLTRGEGVLESSFAGYRPVAGSV
jgi:ribosomal protection tetracycline resistance protein